MNQADSADAGEVGIRSLNIQRNEIRDHPELPQPLGGYSGNQDKLAT
jgi:hypothetical protein